MSENNTAQKDNVIVVQKDEIATTEFEKHESGQLYQIDGKIFEKKDNQTTAQFNGEDIKGTTIERKSSGNTIYLGKEYENDFNAREYLINIIEGATEKIKDQNGTIRHYKKTNGFKDILDYLDIKFSSYAKTCTNFQQLILNKELEVFFSTIKTKPTKDLFITFLLNRKTFNMQHAIKVYMQECLNIVQTQLKEAMAQRFLSLEFDERTYQNIKSVLEPCEEALIKYLAGEIVL